jgi:hypothetical protein
MPHLRTAPILAAVALVGCTTLFGQHAALEHRLKLGETGYFGPLRITPIAIDADSRCPAGVQCVWAGTVRLKVDVYPADRYHAYFVTLGQPEAVEGGTLLLEQVSPARTSTAPIPPNHYAFTLRYTPTES